MPTNRPPLRRSRTNKKIAGVCGGLAEWGGWDPTAVRILFVVGLLLPGPGIIAYLVLWLIVPKEPRPA